MLRTVRSRLGPPAAAMALVGLAAATWPASPASADPSWDPPPCDRSTTAATDRPSWYRLDDALDEAGTVTGRRLVLGTADPASVRVLELPPESSAGGPHGGLVLAVADDGTRSTLRLVDPAAGCAVPVGTSEDVVRSATLDPGRSAVYEHRVERGTRADLGVWRRPLAGGSAEQVLGAPPEDPAYGPTFATELGWGDDGRLVVASCAEVRCRIRVVDPAGGETMTIEDVGPVVGLVGDRLVSHAACAGLPCPVLETSLRTGEQRMLAREAGLAALAGDGDLVVHETLGPRRIGLRAVSLATGESRDLGRLPDGLRLLASSARALAGASGPPRAVVLAPDGRVGPDVAAARQLDPIGGSIRPLWEGRP